MKTNWSKIAKTSLAIVSFVIGTVSLLSNFKSAKEEEEDDVSVYKPTKPKEHRGYVPVGCRACGGPYPLCSDGCPIFDD